MTFKLVARVIAAVFAVLFVVLCFFPASYAPTYGVAANEGVQFLTRRASPMFIGPAIILWIAASADRSPLRDGIVLGFALMCIGIAATGLVAWAQGIAAPLILAAAAAECGMVAALWLAWKN